jgi:hypothetical protein
MPTVQQLGAAAVERSPAACRWMVLTPSDGRSQVAFWLIDRWVCLGRPQLSTESEKWMQAGANQKFCEERSG